MANEIRIPLVADTAQAIRDVSSLGDAFDDVSKSLSDIPQDASRADTALKDVGTGSDRAGDDAQDMARDFDRAFEKIRRDAKAAGNTIEHEGGEATREFKDEATSNFSEVASSFTGDMDSAVDLVQGTLGGLAGSLGPGLGAAAGIAAGAIGALFAMSQEEAEKTKQRITDMTDALIEGGQEAFEENFILNELQKIATGADDAAISHKNLKRAAESLGASEADIARAWAGDQKVRSRLLSEARAEYLKLGQQVSSTEGQAKLQAAARMGELGRWMSALQDLGDDYSTAAGQAALFESAAKGGSRRSADAVAGVGKNFDDLNLSIQAAQQRASKGVKAKVKVDDAELKAFLRSLKRKSYDADFRVKVGKGVI